MEKDASCLVASCKKRQIGFSVKRVGLFIPCYIDIIYPNVALATYKLLTKLGFSVDYPLNQTCCGQPFLNSGVKDEAKALANRFYNIFKDFDYIVAPSASCIATVKFGYKDLLDSKEYLELKEKSFEICEFLTDVVKIDSIDAKFNHKVGFHQSCHGLRELNLARSSELNLPYYSKPLKLLKMVDGIEIVDLKRADECCGFGGVFSVIEPDVSVKMGQDRVQDHIDSGAEYIVGYDSSCLMHMQGVAKKQKQNIKFLHIVEILAGMVEQ